MIFGSSVGFWNLSERISRSALKISSSSRQHESVEQGKIFQLYETYLGKS